MASILVIDDDAPFNTLIQEFLSQQGHNVTAAYNGREGLDRFEEDQPDIVITDIRMPKSDGLDLLLKLRNHGEHAPKGIILMSGLVNAQSDRYKNTLQALGASDFMQKPFPLDELSRKINEILSSNQDAHY